MSTIINLQSSKISIFPTPDRSTDPQARLITEFNLVNIVNRLVDKDSFVISYDDTPDSNSNQNKITFNIHGYWIEADLKDSDLDKGNLYASISITSKSNTNPFAELIGQDSSSGTYTGVKFSTDPFKGDDAKYSLQLLAGGKVPEDSWVKFTNSNHRSVTIDDGDLDS